MASVKFTRDDPEWGVLNEFWLLLQKHYNPEESESYWQALTDDLNEFISKEPKSLRRELEKSMMRFLENKYKEERENVGK